jgi:hypothetical protein
MLSVDGEHGRRRQLFFSSGREPDRDEKWL